MPYRSAYNMVDPIKGGTYVSVLSLLESGELLSDGFLRRSSTELVSGDMFSLSPFICSEIETFATGL